MTPRAPRECRWLPGAPAISLADATSFVVMRDIDATVAFTLDADFAAEGFELIPPTA